MQLFGFVFLFIQLFYQLPFKGQIMENEYIFGSYVYSVKVETFLSCNLLRRIVSAGFGNDTALLTSINFLLSSRSEIFSEKIEANRYITAVPVGKSQSKLIF